MASRLREVLLWAGAVLGLVAVAAGAAVAFFGFSFLVFRSGSMEPEIPTGGLALSRTVSAADIRSGDVVSVVAANGDRITHRVVTTTVRGDEASLVLQGDANAKPDSEIYVVASVERVVTSVPVGGYVIAHALTPPGMVAAACLSLMLLVLGFTRDDEDEDEDDGGSDAAGGDDAAGGGQGGPFDGVGRERGGRHLTEAGRRSWIARSAAVAVVGATTAALIGTTGTLAAFTDKPTGTGSFASNKYFTCDAAARGTSPAPAGLAGPPYLYWKLDEILNLGNAGDSSGNNRPGLYQSVTGISPNQTRACGGDAGTAITLNGSTGFIGQPSGRAAIPGPNTFALSMWFRTGTNRGGKLIGFGNQRTTPASGSYDRHIYMANDGSVVFGVYPGQVRTIRSAAGFNNNAWHHVVASLSPAGMRLFIDGAVVAADPTVTTAEGYSGFWKVGFDNLDSWTDQPSSRYFAGTIDEVAVYASAPTDADVLAAYRAGLPTP